MEVAVVPLNEVVGPINTNSAILEILETPKQIKIEKYKKLQLTAP